MTEEILVIPGDGIGAEVLPVAVDVLDAVGDFEFVRADAGDAVAAETGTALPEEARAAAESADATLFGAAGETAADVVLPLRAAVDSFVNVRPARAYPGVEAVKPETDLVFLRENSEGVYGGHEATLADGVATTTRVITRTATERLAEYACEFAPEGFTIAHKANVMRETDGLFLETVERVAEERGVPTQAELMDAMATHLVQSPRTTTRWSVRILRATCSRTWRPASSVVWVSSRRRTSARSVHCSNRSTAPRRTSQEGRGEPDGGGAVGRDAAGVLRLRRGRTARPDSGRARARGGAADARRRRRGDHRGNGRRAARPTLNGPTASSVWSGNATGGADRRRAAGRRLSRDGAPHDRGSPRSDFYITGRSAPGFVLQPSQTTACREESLDYRIVVPFPIAVG